MTRAGAGQLLRIVLARTAEGNWRPFRQPQWIAEVRRHPDLATTPKLWFDIEEASYRACLPGWDDVAPNLDAARARLIAAGAREVAPRPAP